MINFEKEVIDYLGLPSIPKREHDGKTPFAKGVAVLETNNGEKAYAVCKYEPDDGDMSPVIVKVFGIVPFVRITSIFVVPDYMSNISDVMEMDLDDVSKKNAESILREAEEFEGGDEDIIEEPKNEYFFDNIHSDAEAKAFITSYNKMNRIRGRVPTSHEGLVMRLSVIYSDINNKKGGKNGK